MDENEVDRISNLPEPLVHHILSFLEMKHVVQTSSLSRRWRYVWKTVSSLIRVNTFGAPGFIEMNNFTRFIDKVLLLRGSSDIHKFHLHLDLIDTDMMRELLEDHINTWILVALSRNVQDLLIHIITVGEGNNMQVRFPHCLFNCQSLRKLVLYMTGKENSCVFLPNSMDLPRLKFLSLSAFYTEDVDSINKLISSCPVLESLVLSDIWTKNGDGMSVSIESRELKHLVIHNRSTIWDPCLKIAKIIKLSLPNLVCFYCNDYTIQEYCLENLSSLVTATIDLCETTEGSSSPSLEEKTKVLPKRMMEFLRGFRNVKQLTVSLPDFVKVLGRSPVLLEVQSSPNFYNLQCLRFETLFTRCCLRAMVYLLKACSSVEYLFLTASFIYEPDLPDIDDGGELGLSLPCLLPHLKFIQITALKCRENELRFLEFLLKNAIVLRYMVMSFDVTGSTDATGSADDNRKLMKKFKKKLRTLPRASPSA